MAFDDVGPGTDVSARTREEFARRPAPPPQGRYTAAVTGQNLIMTAGMTPRLGGVMQYAGRIGTDIDLTQARQAARVAVDNAVQAAATVAGSLEGITQLLRLTVYLNADSDFVQHSEVADAASDRLLEIFGDRGVVARSAIGVGSLPGGACLELELTCLQ